MNLQSELNDEYTRIQKLKANIHRDCLEKFVSHTRKNWQPKTKEIEGPVDHGSNMGDLEAHMLYWDESHCNWAIKEIAFQSHLLRKVSEILNENKIEKYK